jgi:hypothetical protein
VTVTDSFAVLDPNTAYTLVIENDGTASATLLLNGAQVVGPNQFNQNVTTIEEPVTLGRTNSLSVEMGGKPGSSFVLKIIGTDNDPPIITATVSPPPNAEGWHNSDPTVTFACADTLSGIQSCPDPITVRQEGANQVLSGTAMDNAGNSATAEVALHLDKTAPGVVLSSPSDGFLFTDSLISIQGTVADTQFISSVTVNGNSVDLVGGAFSSDLTASEGSLTITVAATDIAGNVGTATVSGEVSLSSVFAITAPANLSIVSTPAVDVLGTMDDPTATVTVNGVQAAVSGNHFSVNIALSPGLNVVTAVGAPTAVGTTSEGGVRLSSISITLDNRPPQFTLRHPENGSHTTAETTRVTGFVQDLESRVNATVTVNGALADVLSNSFELSDIPLQVGVNDLTVVARDALGNEASETVQVIRDLIAAPVIQVVSGDHQSGVIGSTLAAPVVAQVSDAQGNPVANQTIVFKVTENNGILNNDAPSVAATTNAQGQAQVTWALGSRAGSGRNRLEARAVGILEPASFSATGLMGAPAQIVMDAGNNQLGIAGQPLPLPFVAVVTDAGHNRVEGVSVTFTVTEGKGHFGGPSILTGVTDSLGLAQAVLTLGDHEGIEDNLVEAHFDGNPGLPVTFVASGRVAGALADTAISGVVLDNSNIPIEEVTIQIEQTPLETVTDAAGQFKLEGIPVQPIRVVVDGRTANRVGTWPTLAYDLTPIPGIDNKMAMPVYLLPINEGLLIDETHGGTLTMDNVPGFALEIAAGSAIFPDGGQAGVVSVTTVHPDKVPMIPNFGQQPRLIVTIQPAGVLFNPPARLTIPNVDGLVPGEITEMYSFDHDAGRFVSIGPGGVSWDGSVITSEPGVGVTKGGWHCGGNPATVGVAGLCPECEKCATTGCVSDSAQNGSVCSDDGNECTDDECQGGACDHQPKGPICGANPSVVVTYNVNIITAAPSMTEPATTDVDTPTFTGSACIDLASGVWQFRVDSVVSMGTITIVPTPDANTPNPVDGGNVTQANYCNIITDLADYTATGFRGPNWHVTQATIDHEDYHWNTEWKGEFNKVWPSTEDKMESVTVVCNTYDDVNAATNALSTMAQADFTSGYNTARSAYNALPDNAGYPPYAAGQEALNAMIDQINAYATSNSWPPCP